jgi:hypothetical protein
MFKFRAVRWRDAFKPGVKPFGELAGAPSSANLVASTVSL